MNNSRCKKNENNGNKSKLKSVRFTPDEYRIVERQAKELGYKNISEYIVRQSTKQTISDSKRENIGLLQKVDFLIHKKHNGEISKGECLRRIEEEVNYSWHTLN